MQTVTDLVRIGFAGMLIVLLGAAPSGAAETIVDLEDLTLDQDSFFNGDPGGLQPGDLHDGSFVSRTVMFNNNFGIDEMFEFPFWGGWAYSNRLDTTTAGFGNQYSAITGAGFDGSENYAIAFAGFPQPTIHWSPDQVPVSMQVTNTTYAFLAIQGDDGGANFSREFGDRPGSDPIETDHPDWFLLKIIGFDEAEEETGTIDFYLADYRTDDDAEDYVVDDWREVNLRSLGESTVELRFELSSSDTGQFGMNTPAFFALDQLILSDKDIGNPFTPGDTDQNGTVTAADFRSLVGHYGQNIDARWTDGDYDGDNTIGLADLILLQANFDHGGGVGAVPEPSAGQLMLVALGLLLFYVGRKKRLFAGA